MGGVVSAFVVGPAIVDVHVVVSGLFEAFGDHVVGCVEDLVGVDVAVVGILGRAPVQRPVLASNRVVFMPYPAIPSHGR